MYSLVFRRVSTTSCSEVLCFFRLTFILTTTEVSVKGMEIVWNQEGKQTLVGERLVVYAMLAMRDTKTIFESFACWGQDQWFLSLCELAEEAISLSNIWWWMLFCLVWSLNCALIVAHMDVCLTSKVKMLHHCRIQLMAYSATRQSSVNLL